MKRQADEMRRRGYVTYNRAAEIAQVSRSTIAYWVSTEKVAAVRQGAHNYVNLKSLKTYIKAYKVA